MRPSRRQSDSTQDQDAHSPLAGAKVFADALLFKPLILKACLSRPLTQDAESGKRRTNHPPLPTRLLPRLTLRQSRLAE
jgi:hypothetical protein